MSTASTKLWSRATTRLGSPEIAVEPMACSIVLEAAADEGVAEGSVEPHAATPATSSTPASTRHALIGTLSRSKANLN
ncbi:hypothetical protein GCM10010176_017480 [Nonomuraea spiralis]|nr:hypothetical protein GCM10010176_017480 [Nonomuraea spiralis]